MSAIQIVIGFLSRDAGVTAITKPSNVFPVEAPQNAPSPYFTVNLVSGHDERLIHTAGKYYQHRVTVDAIGETPAQVLDMGDAAMAALENTIKARIDTFKDVDVWFADVDFTQPNDSRTAFQRVIQFFVRWRRQ